MRVAAPPAGPGGALCAGCCGCAARGVVASTESFRAYSPNPGTPDLNRSTGLSGCCDCAQHGGGTCKHDRVVCAAWRGEPRVLPFRAYRGSHFPADRHHCHGIKRKVKVLRHTDGTSPRPQNAERPEAGINRRPIGCRVRSAITGLPAQSGFSNGTKSGQSMCYQTGQVYLLLTGLRPLIFCLRYPFRQGRAGLFDWARLAR